MLGLCKQVAYSKTGSYNCFRPAGYSTEVSNNSVSGTSRQQALYSYYPGYSKSASYSYYLEVECSKKELSTYQAYSMKVSCNCYLQVEWNR